ncbi:MAG: amino acid adenylation domain-containing protein, partial [Acutalibacteraceae bacterium]|nr:amino acid adenylation domain-containing protein [Acutalibacteraceae bacterium]
LSGVEIEDSGINSTISKFDLSFSVAEYQGNFGIVLEYCTDLYNPETAGRILKHFINILSQVIENIEIKLSELEAISDSERRQILEEFNNTLTDYPRDKTIVELFEEQVEKNPDKTAVVFEDKSLTYAELNASANAVASKLKQYISHPDEVVAIISERGFEQISAIYGALKSGTAYVPIDPSYPKDRIDYIINDSGAKAVLLYKTKISTDLPCIHLDINELITEETLALPNADISAGYENLAYLIYTSGTTGRPKGVMIEQCSVINHLSVVRNNFYSDNNGVTPLFTNYAFDFTVPAIFAALLYGETLALFNDIFDLAEYASKYDVQVLKITPSHFMGVVDDLRNYEKLNFHTIVFGGETLTKEIAEIAYQIFGDQVTVFNEYGPTEATVFSTMTKVERNCEITIGKPVDNYQVYLCNGSRLCGIGMIGEICIAGLGVARGYCNMPELTAEKFTDNPFGNGNIYHTGDLGYWTVDGEIAFLGRSDQQIKLRGFRIEVDEITNQLLKIDKVQDVAVTVSKDGANLCAYYTSDDVCDFEILQNELRNLLPEYMIPSLWMQLDKIPLNANGKLDKNALPEIGVTLQEYVAPRTAEEQIICSIFTDILGVSQVGIKDNFFTLGGHSLRAMRLVNYIASSTGVRISLKDIFSKPTPQELAKLIEGNKIVGEEIPVAEKKEYYPMSSAQKRLYLIDQIDEVGITYNKPSSITLTGSLDIEKLRNAVIKLTERHEALRTSFEIRNQEAVQVISNDVEIDFDVVKVSSDEVDALYNSFVKPFDLSKAPLLRFLIVETENESLCFYDIHHIIADGMSSAIIEDELIRLYNGEELEPLRVQYKDYSEWMLSRDISSQETYWLNEFSEEPPVLNLPLDYQRPQVQSFSGQTEAITLSENITKSIRELSSKTGATDYMILLSCIMIMLSKYSRQDDILIGTPIACRTSKDTENMVGMFVNTIVFRGEPVGTMTYYEFLQKIMQTCLDGYENQEYPFEELVDKLNVPRDLSRNPLFDVMFVLQNQEQSDSVMNDINIQDIVDMDANVSKFDLLFAASLTDGKYSFVLQYCDKLFNRNTIARMLKHFECVLEQSLDNTYQTISSISLMDSTDKELINLWNKTELNHLCNLTPIQLFENQVKKTPDSDAVIFDNITATYSQLNHRAACVASVLKENGVVSGDCVALLTERSIDMLVALLGVLKAGAVYVPIDINYPEARKLYIIKNCEAKAILTVSTEISADIPVIDVEKVDYDQNVDDFDTSNSTLDSGMYLIYTSGTTGNPKGVMVPNRTITNLVSYEYEKMSMETFKSTLFATYYGFDVSVQEYFSTLLCGGCGYLIRYEEKQDVSKCLKLIEKYKINTIFATPSYFEALVSENLNTIINNIKHIILAGETFKLPEVLIKSAADDIMVYNHYGPTETHVATMNQSSIAELKCNGILNIGKPIANTKAWVVTDNSLCGIGIPGELYLTGDCLAIGYVNLPELTNEKFTDFAFNNSRAYRTGDLVRWLPDGTLEYLGRIDEQVKIRGFRIELGEIESKIRDIESVKECAVIARTDKNGDKAIYAYYTGDKEIDISEIRNSLSQSLPEYMIPSYMMQIENIP